LFQDVEVLSLVMVMERSMYLAWMDVQGRISMMILKKK
jgi:hypothetical protein